MRPQRRKADGRRGEIELELKAAIGRAQHIKRRGADLRTDAVAFHDQQLDHFASSLRMSAVRWPAAAIRKPRSVCVVTKRTPFLMKAF